MNKVMNIKIKSNYVGDFFLINGEGKKEKYLIEYFKDAHCDFGYKILNNSKKSKSIGVIKIVNVQKGKKALWNLHANKELFKNTIYYDKSILYITYFNIIAFDKLEKKDDKLLDRYCETDMRMIIASKLIQAVIEKSFLKGYEGRVYSNVDTINVFFLYKNGLRVMREGFKDIDEKIEKALKCEKKYKEFINNKKHYDPYEEGDLSSEEFTEEMYHEDFKLPIINFYFNQNLALPLKRILEWGRIVRTYSILFEAKETYGSKSKCQNQLLEKRKKRIYIDLTVMLHL